MAVIAGIDEAGFGPVLGPLVVSAAAFEVPDELADVSMWRLLAGAVAQKPSKKHPAVPIADSKKLYSRRRGLEHLERGVLGMLAAGGLRPGSLRQLLAEIAPEAWKDASGYPWYAQADLPLPHCISPTDVALAGNALSVGMSQAGIRLGTMRAETLFAGQYNRFVRATNNKSTTLFDVTGRLLMYLWGNSGTELRRIHVDRHGGRRRYLPALQRLFEGCQFKVIDENEVFSAYRITGGRRTAEISFTIGAEQRQLPVALASMLSKYLRELFMTMFNRFWARHVPDLAPTAGYYVDGRRFYRRIQPVVRRLGLDERQLLRCR